MGFLSGDMVATEAKKKKPPTFHYLPKSRAKRLKKSWVEHHKIRSKWKAQKTREGLTTQTNAPIEDASDHAHDETNADSESDEPSNRPERSPTPSHDDNQSLRQLRKLAYASKPLLTQKVDPSHPKRAHGHPSSNRGSQATVGRRTGQPNMNLRMNVLLEKIKRDFSS